MCCVGAFKTASLFLEHGHYLAIRAQLRPEHADVLDFGYLSGWRKREVLRLEWARVDLQANVIHLDPAHSKNKTGRTLPIIAPLREVLVRRLVARHPATSRVLHVDGQPIGDWRKSWWRACDAAGLPGTLFHGCRRTAARNLDCAGVSRSVAMAIMGHKTEAMYRRYNIVSDSDVTDAGRKLDRFLAALPSTPTVVSLRRASATSA